jgi:hypothetical protein
MRLDKIMLTSLFCLLFFRKEGYCRQQKVATGNGFAVVELFTSEGCSSCPAAERVLSQLNDEHQQYVYVMEFHVDYWNYIGWKDVFSSSEYTIRQQKYAGLLGLGSTYTPQAIVNGRNELVGSDNQKLRALIKNNLQTNAANTIGLVASVKGNSVVVDYTLTNTHGQLLNIALVQKKAETDVRRGENSGRKLKHTNVVRGLKTLDAQGKGEISISVPGGLSANDCIIIAYTQDKDNWNITGAGEIAIE